MRRGQDGLIGQWSVVQRYAWIKGVVVKLCVAQFYFDNIPLPLIKMRIGHVEMLYV
jgi:hypothetical protein